MLTRDQIVAIEDFAVEKVEVPEWGGFVFVRVMTAGQRDQFEKKFTADRFTDTRAYLCAATISDDRGELLFTLADVAVLTKKSSAAIDRIFAAAMKINKLSGDDVKELEKNSKANHLDGS
jgi:hypothetical protein